MKCIILTLTLVLTTACVNTPKQEIIYYDYLANKDKLEKMERCRQDASLILIVNQRLLSQEQSVRLYKLLLDSCAIHYGIAI
jgi:hypothetical protein